MRLKDSLESVGMPVKDVYGRDLGSFNGYTLDFAGNLMSIGVEVEGGFAEIAGNRVVSAKKEVVVLPEWKADARDSGFESEILEPKMRALTEMLESAEISQATFDGLLLGFVAPRSRQESLLAKLSQRLDELVRSDDEIDIFLTRVRMQTSDGLSTPAYYTTIRDNCAAIKRINGNERQDLLSVQSLVQKYLSPKQQVELPEGRAEEELVLSNDHEAPAVQEQPTEDVPDETVSQTYGTLRSLRT